jgi:hypothetical protein
MPQSTPDPFPVNHRVVLAIRDLQPGLVAKELNPLRELVDTRPGTT